MEKLKLFRGSITTIYMVCSLWLTSCQPDSTGAIAANSAGAAVPGDQCVVNPVADELFIGSFESATSIRIKSRAKNARFLREVKVNFSALKKPKIKIQISPNQSVIVTIDKSRSRSMYEHILFGRVDGEAGSSVTLVRSGHALVGSLRIPTWQKNYEIRPEGQQGTHLLMGLSEEEPGDCLAFNPPEPGEMDSDSGDSGIIGEDENGEPVIDILVASTPAARESLGGADGIHALALLGIEDTNQAFRNGGVNLQVRLVGELSLEQNESGDFSQDLTDLKGMNDGRWDDVHSERTRLGADQVSLIGAYKSNTSVAGIGFIRASKSSAFTITRTSAFGQYTFTHELGHNIGLYHEDGYVNTSGRFKTIMAYGNYVRIRQFSDSTGSYLNYSIGDGSHNSIATIAANAFNFSNLVAPITPLPTEPPPSNETGPPAEGEGGSSVEPTNGEMNSEEPGGTSTSGENSTTSTVGNENPPLNGEQSGTTPESPQEGEKVKICSPESGD